MKLFLLFFFLLVGVVSFPQKHVQSDTSDVSIRSFSSGELQQLKANEDFQYQQLQAEAPGLWDRFWMWVWWKIAQIMSTKAGSRTVYVILTALAVATIVFFVMRVTGMSKSGLLSRKSSGNFPFATSAEDINSISFEDAIRDAIQGRNFRLAIRLLYLHSLKQLSDKGYIQWKLNKTNADYIREVADKPWQAIFSRLTYTFEYAWYGEMNIGNEEFEQVNLQFQQFNTQLR